MPLTRCVTDGKLGWRWGSRGKCYTGPQGRAKAVRQSQAIRASGYTENAANPLRYDPTRTVTLRRRFETAIRQRFNWLRRQVRTLVLTEDAFGLKIHNVANQRFAFATDARKVEEFNGWLKTQVDQGVLPASPDGGYLRSYVEEGYRKGAGRAFDDARVAARAARGSPEDYAFYQGTREEFLRSSFGQAVATEKVNLLTGRVFTELQGVTTAMATDMTRVLADGLVQGKNPRVIARDLDNTIATMERRRARVIARTEIIRAHAEGQLDALEKMGVDEIGVMVEWSAAYDDRTCQLCADLDGIVMTVKEARGSLPRHPNCRCAYIPANVGESRQGQIRGKEAIEDAIEQSIKDEAPRLISSGKRTVAEQAARTRWAGADTKIQKARPSAPVYPRLGKIPPGRKPSGTISTVGEREAGEVTTIRQAEKDLQTLSTARADERGYLVDAKTGEVILVNQGTATEVTWRPESLRNPDGLIMLHNHPSSNGFSGPDWMAQLRYPDIVESRVVTGETTYVSRLKPGAKEKLEEIRRQAARHRHGQAAPGYRKTPEQIWNEEYERLRASDEMKHILRDTTKPMDQRVDEYTQWLVHQANKRVAEVYDDILTYEVITNDASIARRLKVARTATRGTKGSRATRTRKPGTKTSTKPKALKRKPPEPPRQLEFTPPTARLYVKKIKSGRQAAMETLDNLQKQLGIPRAKYASRELELEAAILDGAQHKEVLIDAQRRIVGAVALSEEAGEASLWIEHLGALSDVQGTGTELMRRALRIAQRKGLGVSWQSSNEAIGFYERLGFKMVNPQTQVFEVPADAVSKSLERLGMPGKSKPPKTLKP